MRPEVLCHCTIVVVGQATITLFIFSPSSVCLLADCASILYVEEIVYIDDIDVAYLVHWVSFLLGQQNFVV